MSRGSAMMRVPLGILVVAMRPLPFGGTSLTTKRLLSVMMALGYSDDVEQELRGEGEGRRREEKS